MAESTIHQLISEREGKVWTEIRRFKSLDDVLFWIGRGIGVMENEINHVRMKIVSTLIFDFVGFTKEGNALIYHSHLMEINRLHMKRAVVTNGYTSSEFAKYGR